MEFIYLKALGKVGSKDDLCRVHYEGETKRMTLSKLNELSIKSCSHYQPIDPIDYA